MDQSIAELEARIERIKANIARARAAGNDEVALTIIRTAKANGIDIDEN